MIAKEAPLIRITFLIALGCGIVLVRSTLGDENENASEKKAASDSTTRRIAVPEQSKPPKKAASGDEGHVRHHGALGVLLGKSDERDDSMKAVLVAVGH